MIRGSAISLGLALLIACSDGGEGNGDSGADAGAGGRAGATGGMPGTGGSTAASGGSNDSGGSGTGGASSASGGTGGGSGGGSGGAGGTGGVPATDPPCDATCHFIRAGGAGDGSTWDSSWAELPDTLERGHRYYVGAGDYGGHDFDDAGGTEPIQILRATEEQHGSNAGWQSAFGASTPTFGVLRFSRPGYVMDGRVPGGFHVIGDFQGSVVSIASDYVTLRYLDVDGNFGTNGGGTHDQGACTGIDIGGDRVTVESSEIHDAADDGVSASGAVNLRFAGNTVHALHACGTDGGCGPCYNGHSDGLETYNVKQSQFIGNFIYDVRSTSTFFFGNWADTLGNGPSEYCEDILLENNVFYAPEVGLVAYLQDVARIDVYHNVFWGVRQGGYGGLSIGPHVTDLRLYNNVILSINTAHTNGGYVSGEHESDYNLFGVDLGQWTTGANDAIAGDPGFVGIGDLNAPRVMNPSVLDFLLEATSDAVDEGYVGDASIVLPTVDFRGTPRDSRPDMGAFEL
jgi:hypothetical protein